MILKAILTLFSIAISGFLYRCGGMSVDEVSKIPKFLRKSWIRDWLIPAFSLIILFTWWKPNVWWGYLLILPTYILNGFALSSYWSWLTKLWRNTKTKYWENWLLHGFFIGLSFFLFIGVGLKWYSILVNALLSGLLMMWISERSGKVFTEEFGRGAISTATRLVLLIK